MLRKDVSIGTFLFGYSDYCGRRVTNFHGYNGNILIRRSVRESEHAEIRGGASGYIAHRHRRHLPRHYSPERMCSGGLAVGGRVG